VRWDLEEANEQERFCAAIVVGVGVRGRNGRLGGDGTGGEIESGVGVSTDGEGLASGLHVFAWSDELTASDVKCVANLDEVTTIGKPSNRLRVE
jgi:hypothetical protein